MGWGISQKVVHYIYHVTMIRPALPNLCMCCFVAVLVKKIAKALHQGMQRSACLGIFFLLHLFFEGELSAAPK